MAKKKTTTKAKPKATKKAKPDEVRRVVRSLQVELADDDLRQRATAVAVFEMEVVELKERVKKLNTRIKGIRGAILEHCKSIQEGNEERDIPVDVTFCYRRNTVTETRIDTGEVIDSRAMTVEERQENLDLGAVDAIPPSKPKVG